MENLSDNEELTRHFLLGDLAEPERAQIEDRFLADQDFYQELLSIEDDLIDAYVRDQLPPTERAQFEQRYMASPSQRKRVEFAQTLLASVSSKTVIAERSREPGRTVSRWRSFSSGLVARRPALAFAIAVVLLAIVAGIWLLAEKARTRPAPEEAQTRQSPPASSGESPQTQVAEAENPKSNSENENANAPARETPKRESPVVATFMLLPGAVRGEGGAQLTLPAGATAVRLQLGTEGDAYKKYRATLSTPEGRALLSRLITNSPSRKSAHLTLSLPARLLKAGDYILSLSGTNGDAEWESIADYSFRIVRK